MGLNSSRGEMSSAFLSSGQNINYFYQKTQNLANEQGLKYSKEVTDKNGIIIGKNQFEVKLILDTKDQNINRGSADFDVVDEDFISCKWIEHQ